MRMEEIAIWFCYGIEETNFDIYGMMMAVWVRFSVSHHADWNFENVKRHVDFDQLEESAHSLYISDL
jgi:hypothetical protein